MQPDYLGYLYCKHYNSALIWAHAVGNIDFQITSAHDTADVIYREWQEKVQQYLTTTGNELKMKH